MELDMLIILLSHLKHITTISHEYITTILVRSHILRLAPLDHIQFRCII